MTSVGELANDARSGISAIARQIAANIAIWAETLLRAPRAAYVYSLSRTETRSWLVIAAVVVVMLIAYVDAPAASWGKTLPGWLIGLFDEFTDFGKAGWFLWPLGLALLAIAALDRPELAARTRLVVATLTIRLGFLFLAIALPSLFTTIVKRLIGRARPLVEGNDPLAFYPFIWDVKYAALPSGHATTAFAAAFAIAALWPASRPFMWAYAVGIAFSRVVLNAHHPSDVLAGAVVAFVGVTLVRDVFASQSLGFNVTAEGIRPRPGPSWRRIKGVARALAAQ